MIPIPRFPCVASLTLLILATACRLAEAQTPVVTADTNAPVAITNGVPPPVVTNVPPVSTNTLPVIKPVIRTSGADLIGPFGCTLAGKFSVSGRTLRLPVPESTTRDANDWRRTMNFGMNMAKGNSESLRYSLGLDAVKEQPRDLFRIRAKGSYGESAGRKDTENAAAAGRYERLLTTNVYALANCEWFADPMADLRYRVTGILSPGLRLIRTPTTLINIEVGAGYIEERKASTENGYAAGRLALTTERVVNTHVLAWITGEYLPKLADPGVFFINAESGIASYVTRDLSLNAYCQERYDSNPVAGKKSTDTLLAVALGLNF